MKIRLGLKEYKQETGCVKWFTRHEFQPKRFVNSGYWVIQAEKLLAWNEKV